VRVLITGSAGLLGGRLALILRDRVDVVGSRHAQPSPQGVGDVHLDLDDEPSIRAAVEASRPDAVIHCAALADADACERDPEKAYRVNVIATATLARVCRSRGVRLIALSTDLVLPGTRAFTRESSEPPEPRLVYARTKLAAEAAVLAESPDFVVLRVALVIGRGHGPRPTASESVAWTLAAGRPARLFTDQFRTPIDPESVATALATLLTGRGSGLYHLGGPERLTRHQLGVRVARALALDPAPLDPVAQAELPIGAPRPSDVSMDSSRAVLELGWQARPLDEALRESRRQPD
jgi:dTDP-4-dehydrorhamnose reductase